jgi:hypothetical protein
VAPPLPVSPYFSPENLRELESARAASRKIFRAVSVAQLDGYAIAAFAAITILCSLTSLTGLVLGIGMGVVAWVELRSAGRLRRLEPAAIRTLTLNQLGLGLLLVLYSLYHILTALLGGPGSSALASGDPELARMMQPIENLTRMIELAVYAGLILAALAAQGGLALYYSSRTRHLLAYLQQTPGWVVDLQKTGAFQ